MYDDERNVTYMEGAYMHGQMKVQMRHTHALTHTRISNTCLHTHQHVQVVFGQRYEPVWGVDFVDKAAPSKVRSCNL